MSEDAKWILGIGLPVVLALAGVVWTMLNRRIESIWDQIGRSSEVGMRKTVHSTDGNVRVLMAHAEMTDERFEKLERKVFNGHRPESER